MFLIIRIFSRIRVHFFFYVVTFIMLFTGHFRDYFICFVLLLFHEFGHLCGAFFFKWKVLKIVLLPFGGLIIFDNLINTSLFEEFIVTLLGPVFQVVLFLVLNYCFNLSNDVVYYNFLLLFFNLLPIFPLDGSKLFSVFLYLIFPFYFGHIIMIVVSVICLLLLFCFNGFNVMYDFLLVFLFVRVITEAINHKFFLFKFLFERYSYSLNFKKVKYVRGVQFMFKSCKHFILSDKKYVDEKNYLLKMFDKSG